jgi:hypothetical protein
VATVARAAARYQRSSDDGPAGIGPTVRPPKAWAALREASRALRDRVHGPIGGDTLGLLLASEGVDSDLLDPLAPEYLARVADPPGRQDPHFFEAFANFPEGRTLRALGHLWGARGPQLNVYGSSLRELELVATLLLETGRADRLIVGAADRREDGEVEAELAVLERAAACAFAPDVSLGPRSLLRPISGDSVASLAERSLSEFLSRHAVDREGAAVVFATFLGSTAEAPYRKALGLAEAPDFRSTLAQRAVREGFATTVFLGGFPGAGLSALVIGSDLIRTGRAERVVVCGADIARGALNDSLSIIGCEIPSVVADGSACVLLEAGTTGERVEVVQFAPEIRPRRPVEFDSAQSALRTAMGRSVSTVVTSGCTDLDMQAAGDIAARLWPGATLEPKVAGRMLATDVLAILAEAEGPIAIASANTLGGTGVIVTSSRADAGGGRPASPPPPISD